MPARVNSTALRTITGTNQKIGAGDSTFVYLRNLDFAELPVDGTNIYVVNATDGDHLSGSMRVGGQSYSVKVFDRFLGLETEDLQVHASPGGVIDINHAVQQGGMLVLSRNVEDQ